MLIRVEDWAPREKILKSYELLARYVMPQFQGSLVGIQTSNQWAADIKDSLQVNRKAALQAAETLIKNDNKYECAPGGLIVIPPL
ncbi:MAG: hypothetical protein CM1200mP15_10290 [Dehalococcoidia bacterium]|nr:MAG: hypothetical protein CM1200mP15_10290 [Dehalococcoidia bacterium]